MADGEQHRLEPRLLDFDLDGLQDLIISSSDYPDDQRLRLYRQKEDHSFEEVTTEASAVLTKEDAMEGVADLIPSVQVEAVFTDGSRLVTVHSPIQ